MSLRKKIRHPSWFWIFFYLLHDEVMHFFFWKIKFPTPMCEPKKYSKGVKWVGRDVMRIYLNVMCKRIKYYIWAVFNCLRLGLVGPSVSGLMPLLSQSDSLATSSRNVSQVLRIYMPIHVIRYYSKKLGRRTLLEYIIHVILICTWFMLIFSVSFHFFECFEWKKLRFWYRALTCNHKWASGWSDTQASGADPVKGLHGL